MRYKIGNTEGLEKIECFLFDMDGTLYLGNDRLPGAKELIELLHRQGKKVMYITNNSSKVASEYVKKLANMGISASEDEFFTSAEAIVTMMNREKPGARIFLLGTPGLERFMEEQGFVLVREYTRDPEKKPDYVVMGFDQTLTYDKLRIACDYIFDGVTYIATHPDMVCPAEGNRVIPDAGSFMLLIEGVTGKRPSLIAGKPDPTMINIIADRFGFSKDKMLVVGDRLHTDILSGINAGAVTCCVLSGETDQAILKASPHRPDYVLNSVEDIYLALNQ